MKKLLAIISTLFLIPFVASAAYITVPQSTAYGQVLIGNASGGNYTPVATSTLGITGGGGGSSGGTWSTTTSSVAGHLINYSNNNTDIVTVGGSSTSSAQFIFDPNSQIGYFSGDVGIQTKSPNYPLEVYGEASSTSLGGSNLSTCNGATSALTWSGGLFGCNTIAAGFSTTSANYWALTGQSWSTTSANYWGGAQGYLTSSGAVTSLAQTYGTAQTGAITLGTTTDSFNGLSANEVIKNSGGAFTFSNNITGTLTVAGGGTGDITLPTSQLLYGAGAGAIQSVATTTVSCSGSASCTPFTIIGSSPITISASGSGTNYFTSSGSNTYLNTGSNLEAPTFTATSTTGTSTIQNVLLIGTTTEASVPPATMANIFIDTTNTQYPTNGISIVGNTNNYIESIVTNENTGNTASADSVWQNDEGFWLAQTAQGGQSKYYFDCGIDSSVFTLGAFGGANDAFCDATDGATYWGTSGSTTEAADYFVTNSLTRMTITSAGNVGIGTTSPDATFSVGRSVWASTPIIEVASSTLNQTGSTSLFYIDGNGDVGFGTSSPESTFDIEQPAKIATSNSFAAIGLELSRIGYASGYTSTAPTDAYGIFVLGGATAGSITNGGLGIYGIGEGASNAYQALQLWGLNPNNSNISGVTGVSISGAQKSGGSKASMGTRQTILGVNNNGGSNLFDVLGGGMVGIGTTTPALSVPLDVTEAATTTYPDVLIGTPNVSGGELIMVDATAGHSTCTQIYTVAGAVLGAVVTCPTQ